MHVVKLGGSLLVRSDVIPSLSQWLDSRPRHFHLLVVGGGNVVNAIRQLFRTLALSEIDAHWLAIRGMSLNAAAIALALSRERGHPVPVITCLADLEQPPDAGCAILDPIEVLPTEECNLPENWSTTSDSIAAWVARQLRAEELILLKSRPARGNWLLDADLVDPNFRDQAESLPSVRVVNLPRPPGSL